MVMGQQTIKEVVVRIYESLHIKLTEATKSFTKTSYHHRGGDCICLINLKPSLPAKTVLKAYTVVIYSTTYKASRSSITRQTYSSCLSFSRRVGSEVVEVNRAVDDR
jgi:hypothetical protein